MAELRVDVPRLNANEDQVLVVDVLALDGVQVKKGDLLFVVESTKASLEVEAPAAGVVRRIGIAKGEMADVGKLLCVIEAEGAGAPAPAAVPASQASASAKEKITAKAKLRAAELGVDPALAVARDGIIGVAEIEALAASSAGKTAATQPLLAEAASHPSAKGLTTLKAVIVGAGTHAAIIADALQGLGYDLVGATDRSMAVGTEVLPGLKVIGSDDLLPALLADGVCAAFIGVGGATENKIRRKIFNNLKSLGFFLPHAVSPRATVGVGVTLGPATYVMPGAVIGPRSRIGANVVVNTGCIICHDAVIDDHVHITPGAVLAGSVTVGESATVGMGATVLFQTKIGANVLVHNNASVVGDIGDNLEFTRDGQRSPRR